MYGFHKINKTLRSPSSSSSSTTTPPSPEASKQKQKQAEEQIWEFSHVDFFRGGSSFLDSIKRKSNDLPPVIVGSTNSTGSISKMDGEVRGRTMLGVNGKGIHKFPYQQVRSPTSLALPLQSRSFSPSSSSYQSPLPQHQQISSYEDQYLDQSRSRRDSYASTTSNSNFYPSPTPSFYNSPLPTTSNLGVGNYSSPDPSSYQQQFGSNQGGNFSLPNSNLDSNQYQSPPPRISSRNHQFSPSTTSSHILALSQQQDQRSQGLEEVELQSSDKKRIKLSPSPTPLPLPLPSSTSTTLTRSLSQSNPQSQSHIQSKQYTNDQEQNQILWDDLLRSHSQSKPSSTSQFVDSGPQQQQQQREVEREEGLTYPFYEGIQLELELKSSRSTRNSRTSVSSSNLSRGEEGLNNDEMIEEREGEGYRGGSEIRKW